MHLNRLARCCVILTVLLVCDLGKGRISSYRKICSVELVLLENILSGYNLNACQQGQVELDSFLKLI